MQCLATYIPLQDTGVYASRPSTTVFQMALVTAHKGLEKELNVLLIWLNMVGQNCNLIPTRRRHWNPPILYPSSLQEISPQAKRPGIALTYVLVSDSGTASDTRFYSAKKIGHRKPPKNLDLVSTALQEHSRVKQCGGTVGLCHCDSLIVWCGRTRYATA